MKLLNILGLLFGLLLMGCEVLELPDDTGKINEQKIQVSFDFGSDAIALDDELIYYNFTELNQNLDSYILTSNLKQNDSCILNCPNSFQLNCLINAKTSEEVRGAFKNGKYNFGFPNSNSYSYVFSYLQKDSIPLSSFDWTMTDIVGQIYSDQTVFDTLEVPLNHVELGVVDINGNTCQIHNSFNNIIQSEHFKSVDLLYQFDSSNSTLTVIHDYSSSSIESWLIVNEKPNVPFSNEVTIQVTPGDSIDVFFMSDDIISQQIIHSFFVLEPESDGGSLHVQMDIEQEFVQQQGIQDLQLIFTDDLGVEWINLPWHNDDYFEILNVEEYLINENGDNTILVELEFSVTMISAQTGEFRSIKNGQATMAFAIPK